MQSEIRSEFNLRRYLRFVELFKYNIKEKYKTESHHILPVCYFPEFEHCNWNRVNLPKRAHFIAHRMLAYAIGGKMWQAFQLMGRIKSHNSRDYKYFKEEAQRQNSCPIKRSELSKTITELWKNEEYRQLQIDSHKGYVLTPEHIQKISDSLIGRKKPEGFRVGLKLSEETKLKLSLAKIGLKNPSIKPITIFNNFGECQFTIIFSPAVVLKDMNLPTSLVETAKNLTKLYDNDMRPCDISKLKNAGKYKFKGWYARYSKYL